MYRAMRVLGKEVTFDQLVLPKYIGSPKGSSMSELMSLAKDFGLYAEPVERMSYAMLSDATSPVVLHVKQNPGMADYTHWILLLGMEDGKLRICDGTNPLRLMSLEELDSIWDGIVLIVSDSPIRSVAIAATSITTFISYAGIVVFLTSLLYLTQRHFLSSNNIPATKHIIRMCVQQILALLLIGLVSILGLRTCRSQGYLSYSPALAAIRDRHVASFLPKVKADQVARLLDQPTVILVDARFPEDFDTEHLRNAINIPPILSLDECRGALDGVEQSKRILIYCQSNGCPYSEKVAKKLLALGFSNIVLFEDGWIGWQKYKKSGAN
jgi:rhodanese-related sulfurtransferase